MADIYRKVLNIAQKEKAVTEGLSYDLMYVNRQYHRQYMFLRKAGNSLLMVVANFDDAAAEVDVCIPAHAFEFLKLREKSYKATDLLSDEKTTLSLEADKTVHIEVPARYAVVYKLRG